MACLPERARREFRQEVLVSRRRFQWGHAPYLKLVEHVEGLPDLFFIPPSQLRQERVAPGAQGVPHSTLLLKEVLATVVVGRGGDARRVEGNEVVGEEILLRSGSLVIGHGGVEGAQLVKRLPDLGPVPAGRSGLDQLLTVTAGAVGGKQLLSLAAGFRGLSDALAVEALDDEGRQRPGLGIAAGKGRHEVALIVYRLEIGE